MNAHSNRKQQQLRHAVLPGSILALTLALSACGNTSQPITTPAPTLEAEASTAPTVRTTSTDTADTLLGNEPFAASTNAWGPVERNKSNGEQAAGDGRTITLNGKTYTSGLGVHAGSSVTYNLAGKCQTFTADIGVDDFVGSNGSVIFQVFTDGTKIYDSGVMRGPTATKTVNVSVAGKQELRLVVTDAGDGNTFDHADWANAKLLTCSTTQALSALTPTTSTNAWGPVERNQSNGEQAAGDGRTITLNGKTYTSGLGVHAGSSVTYNLAGRYTTFRTDIGVDDFVGSNGSVIFQVFADGTKIYESARMTGASATQTLNLSVAGRQELRLVVTDAGDGNTFDHADWAGATLLRTTPLLDAPVTTVTPAPTVSAVSVTPTTLALTTGTTGSLTAAVTTSGGAAQTVTWTSSNPQIATVDASGVVTAVSAGTATITATSTADGTKTGASTVTVTAPATVTGVTVTPSTLAITTGTTGSLTAQVGTTGGAAQTVTWTSSNPQVATVSSSGVVTAVAAGSATITATSTADTTKRSASTVTVTVPATVSAVSVTPTTLALTTGTTGSLTAAVTTSGGAAQTVTWTSSNPQIATVDASGVVTAVSAGTATITATSTADGTKTGASTVTVTAPVAAAPAPAPAPTYSAPITITKGGTYTGNWESTDPNVPAVRIQTSEPVIITGSNIRFTGMGVQGFNNRVTIQDTNFVGRNPNVLGKSVWRAINLEDVFNAVIQNNSFEHTGGIYFRSFRGSAAAGETIKVLRNVAKNMDGRQSDGRGGYTTGRTIVQFVQFNAVQRIANAEIAWNQVINEANNSLVEDNINMYVSSGTSTSPIRIHNNYIQGAYPYRANSTDFAGGGIILGDGSGTTADQNGYIHAYNNHVLSATNYGIAIVGGVHQSAYNNRVIASGRFADGSFIPAQNVGIYMWDYSKVASQGLYANNTMNNNTVAWTKVNADGSSYNNPWWFPDGTTNGSAYSGNTNLGTATSATEQAEFTGWTAKLSSNSIVIGPR